MTESSNAGSSRQAAKSQDRPAPASNGALALRWVFLVLFVGGFILGVLERNALIMVIFGVGILLNAMILVRFRRRP